MEVPGCDSPFILCRDWLVRLGVNPDEADSHMNKSVDYWLQDYDSFHNNSLMPSVL